MSERDKIHTGELYLCGDEDLLTYQQTFQDKAAEYNKTLPSEGEKRMQLLQELFAEMGEGSYIEAPFYANWGGHHVHVGKHVYTNYGLTLVDDSNIYIGDNTMCGPNVTICTAAHPIQPALRAMEYQYNMPVHIGNNVWLGAGVTVLPGVTIGDNTVVGAGSVVTKDLPANVVAYGTPAKVIREINEHDDEYYYKDRRIPEDLKKYY